MKTALVLFADGSEELEAVTVVNILRRAGISVTLAGLSAGALRGSRGVSILPDTTLDAVLHDSFDMIVLPGGHHRSIQHDQELQAVSLRFIEQALGLRGRPAGRPV